MVSDPGTSTQKKERPIVPYLKLGEKPHLIGSKCKSCGQSHLGTINVCPKCSAVDQMEEVALSRTGEVFVFTIVHQSAPGIPTPYVAAIVDLPDGVAVRCNLTGVEPSPEAIKPGMKVQLVTEKVREDKEGNDVIAYKFKPV